MYNWYKLFGEQFDNTYESLNILHILLISNSKILLLGVYPKEIIGNKYKNVILQDIYYNTV